MKPQDFDTNRLIEYLQGTCNSLDSALDELYPGMLWTDLTAEDHEAIDNEIFLCDICSWWYEISELSDEDSTCESCKDSQEEDEE